MYAHLYYLPELIEENEKALMIRHLGCKFVALLVVQHLKPSPIYEDSATV
jgi:hypothetical protein